jgi:hypothetical protein
MPPLHFLVFIAVSLAVFIGILHWVLRARPSAPPVSIVMVISLVVVVIGMCFAKFGANLGLAWPIYYGVPAATTLLLPPLALRMTLREASWYVALAFASSPAIHVFFSVFVGWPEYLPFWHVPSLSSEWHSALVALAVSCAVILLIYGAIRAVGLAKHRSAGVGAVGWAMLFLTSGRMPPPPPASQIEDATHGEKGEGSSGEPGDE